MEDKIYGFECLEVIPLGFLAVAFAMALISVDVGDAGKAIVPLPLTIPADGNPLLLGTYILWQIRYMVSNVWMSYPLVS